MKKIVVFTAFLFMAENVMAKSVSEKNTCMVNNFTEISNIYKDEARLESRTLRQLYNLMSKGFKKIANAVNDTRDRALTNERLKEVIRSTKVHERAMKRTSTLDEKELFYAFVDVTEGAAYKCGYDDFYILDIIPRSWYR